MGGSLLSQCCQLLYSLGLLCLLTRIFSGSHQPQQQPASFIHCRSPVQTGSGSCTASYCCSATVPGMLALQSPPENVTEMSVTLQVCSLWLCTQNFQLVAIVTIVSTDCEQATMVSSPFSFLPAAATLMQRSQALRQLESKLNSWVVGWYCPHLLRTYPFLKPGQPEWLSGHHCNMSKQFC